jgi:hypothetical protein
MAYTTIDKPSNYFTTKLYAGNDSGQSITMDFAPNWVWIKDRGGTDPHGAYDSVRGALKQIRVDLVNAERTLAGTLTSFNSDGFTVGNDDGTNDNAHNFVSWNWRAGTSFTNDASSTGIGTIDSAGSVNTDAGFSITKFTADGNNLTAAHGLGVAPTMIITKNLSISKNSSVYHSSLGAGKSIFLTVPDAADTDNTYWNNTAPTSTTLSYGTWSGNNNGNEIIAYCFAEKQGYSKFGSYTGNGNADGPFVYTGFEPALVIRKVTDASSDWIMQDNKRSESGGSNMIRNYLFPNSSQAEISNQDYFNIDFLSNGFKMRSTDGGANGSGNDYIYMAFAEAPLVNSNGAPANAR